jgi:hypothetical protein
MSLEFGTDAWIKAAMTALNDSPSYARRGEKLGR